MTNQLHLAAQYLAAAGISFLEKKEDDSHTNLGFSVEDGNLFTRDLNDAGDRLKLSYQSFALEWSTNKASASFKLDGNTHANALKWIRQQALGAGIKNEYSYDLHYELPHKITNDFVFKLLDVDKLKALLHLRILVQLILEKVLQEFQLDSEIRLWPHHFDTGSFAMLNKETGLAIGLGLAIPDSMCDDYYFYISGYHGHDSVATKGFASLTNGKWYNNGFKGAILPATDVDEAMGTTFFRETINAYKS